MSKQFERLVKAAECVLDGELGDMACHGSDNPHEHALGEIALALAEFKAQSAQAEPVAWERLHPDGSPTGEYLANHLIEPVRRNSKAWRPLYDAPQQTQEPNEQELREASSGFASQMGKYDGHTAQGVQALKAAFEIGARWMASRGRGK